MNPLPPSVSPLPGARFGMRCPRCARAAMYLRPQSFTSYGEQNLFVGERTIFNDELAPYKHDARDGQEIICQWCGVAGLKIHTSQFGQFLPRTGVSVEEEVFLLN